VKITQNNLFLFLAIGQETYGWEIFSDVVTEEECAGMMSAYEDFNVGEKYYASPFWNVIRKIETALGNEPCVTGIKKYSKIGNDSAVKTATILQ
jgi:hypothetical protein